MREANRLGEEIQEGAQRFGREYQKAAETGVEAASRIRTWEQLIGVKSLDQAIQIQSDYAKRFSESHMAELSKLGQMYVELFRDAAKPVEQSSKGFAQIR